MTERVLDKIDIAILRNLFEDGRISNVELADRVGLSPSPCWQRVRRLEAAGYITGYGARIDQARLSASEIVIVEVTLERHDDDILESFGKAMSRIPEVLEVWLVTGAYDYLVKVAVDGTAGYEEFLRKRLYRVPGIRHSRSSFTLRCLKQVGAYFPE